MTANGQRNSVRSIVVVVRGMVTLDTASWFKLSVRKSAACFSSVSGATSCAMTEARAAGTGSRD